MFTEIFVNDCIKILLCDYAVYIIRKNKYMKNSVIAGPYSYYIVITTLVYALLAPVFFEMDHAYGQGLNSVNYTDKTMTYSQQPQLLEKDCKSPCHDSAKMCIAM